MRSKSGHRDEAIVNMTIRVLVTGGTGLFGKAIESVLQSSEGHIEEEWFFVGSKEADLT